MLVSLFSSHQWLNSERRISKSSLQCLAKESFPRCEDFVPALARHSCQALSDASSQPGNLLLAHNLSTRLAAAPLDVLVDQGEGGEDEQQRDRLPRKAAPAPSRPHHVSTLALLSPGQRDDTYVLHRSAVTELHRRWIRSSALAALATSHNWRIFQHCNRFE